MDISANQIEAIVRQVVASMGNGAAKSFTRLRRCVMADHFRII